MKPKQIEALESYIKTENTYWNEFNLKLLCEALQLGQFDNPVTPLQLFSDSFDLIIENNTNPIKAIQLFAAQVVKNKLTENQKLFIYEWVYKYFRESEFEGIELTEIKELLHANVKRLKLEQQPVKPLVKNIRDTLKDLMQKELSKLPETLQNLEPYQRINIICKLIPFVLPKVETIDCEAHEPSGGEMKALDWFNLP